MIGALGLHPAKGPLWEGAVKNLLIFDWGREPVDMFSPSVRPYGLPPPSQREAFGVLPHQCINWPGGGV